MFIVSFQKLILAEVLLSICTLLGWKGINRKPPVLTMSTKSIIHYKKKEKDSGRGLGKPPNHFNAFTDCTNCKDLLSQYEAPTRPWIITGINGELFSRTCQVEDKVQLDLQGVRRAVCLAVSTSQKHFGLDKEAHEKMWATYMHDQSTVHFHMYETTKITYIKLQRIQHRFTMLCCYSLAGGKTFNFPQPRGFDYKATYYAI